MKKYLFCVFLLSIALNIFGENKVAGIEIHNNFKNIPSHSSLNYDFFIKWKNVVFLHMFGKLIIPVPSSIKVFFPFYCSYMKSGNSTWVVSLIGNKLKKYDYTNVYWDGNNSPSVDLFFGYINLTGHVTFSQTQIDQNLVGEKMVATIGPFFEDTMYFMEANFDLAPNKSNERSVKPSLSSFGKKYPNASFVNDMPTDVVVRVIAPNNPHYDEYCKYLKGADTRSDRSVVMTNWDEYATEVKIRAGETLTLPDTNNVFHIEADMSGDDDEDGLPNEEEIFLYGTNPSDRDTDGDGLEDGVEISDQTIILNITGNFKTNIINTIANWYDTDGDGISDGDEILRRHPYVCDSETNYYVTDPTSPDTDEDGLNDDIDPHPLDPCNNSNATQVSEDWANYWSDIAQRAGLTIVGLADANFDSDGDGIDNLTEMKNKTNPIFTNGFRKVVFEPTEIHFSLEEEEMYTNDFFLSVFSSDAVTGAVYISALDWKPLLDMEELSVYWEDCPLDQNNNKIRTFSSRFYKRFKFSFLLNHSDMNSAVRSQEIRVVDTSGMYGETLTLVWDAEEGCIINEAPTQPILLEPINGVDKVLEYPNITETQREYEQVDFAWLPSADPENEAVSYHFYLYGSGFDLIYDEETYCTNISLSTEMVHFERGYCYWQVIAKDPQENERSSDSGVFFISSPGDTDNDGVDDDYEIKRGSDPFDPNDYPLTIASPENLDDGFVGREYFYRLKADGGKRKKYIWRASDESTLPPGVHLDPNGEIRGKPTEDGNYIFKVSVFDGKDVFSKSLRITVLPKREGLILRLGKGLIKQR